MVHKFETIAAILIIFVLIAGIFFTSDSFVYSTNVDWSSGNEIWVDDDYPYPDDSDGSISKPYTRIDTAISAASNGDTLKVKPGKYPGGFTIDKSVKIIGEDKNETFIKGSDLETYLINIDADTVALENVYITDQAKTSHRKALIHISSDRKDVSIVNCIIKYSEYGFGIYYDGCTGSVVRNCNINYTVGIFFENAHGNTLYGNKIDNSSGTYGAIKMYESNSNLIEKNEILFNNNGIYSRNCDNTTFKENIFHNITSNALNLKGGREVTIYNNSFHGNGNIGIDINSPYSLITKNKIYNNSMGINLDCSYCTIAHNKIANHTSYGIYTKSGTKENIIYNNTFKDDSPKILQTHAKDSGNNIWYYEGIGNFWSDFYGPNPNSNSTLTTLKDSDFYYTKNSVLDKYPLGRYNEPPEISLPSPYHLESSIPLHTTLKVFVVDPDPDQYKSQLTTNFYYLQNNVSHYIDTDIVRSGVNTSIPFYSTDQNSVYKYIGAGYDYICVWYVIVKDQYSQTRSSDYIFSTLEVPINNDPPQADIAGPYTGQVSEKIEFDASGSIDTDGEIEFYRWNFGDDTSITNVIKPKHSYTKPGEYTASLVVIDNNGGSDTITTLVSVEGQENDPPIANPNGPYSIQRNQILTFSSSGSTDPDINLGDTITYYWDLGDGTNSTEEFPQHNYSIAGNYTVKLTVTDNEGLTNTGSTYVLVKTQNSDTGVPGFELIITIAGIIISITLLRKRKQK